jgi:hypothetical protein
LLKQQDVGNFGTIVPAKVIWRLHNHLSKVPSVAILYSLSHKKKKKKKNKVFIFKIAFFFFKLHHVFMDISISIMDDAKHLIKLKV